MLSRHMGRLRQGCITAIGLTLAVVATTGDAQARRHHGHGGHFARAHFGQAHRGHRMSLTDSPRFAAMVVDANTGHTLYAVSENELRHPASITKVMTLYLLFEKLQSGDMRLDTRIPVSAHAASQAPTKLGLRPGSTIAVEDAIKSIVTKSANDMAVAVAEAVGGDESSFAEMMTRKAHALGMSRTQYVNASGLPDDRQLTTAHDLTILGRDIKDSFPQYYHYFSIPSFTYAGSYMANHNHLMARLEGMDGIKTGYTRASGFNLLSSVNRGGHRLISVVLGGKSAVSRDNIMASLVEEHIEEAAPTRMASAEPPRPVEDAAPTPTVRTAAIDVDQDEDSGPKERGPSLIAPTLAVPAVPPVRPVDHARTVGQAMATGSIPMPQDRPRPAFIAGAPKIDPARLPPPMAANDRHRLVLDGSTNGRPTQSGSTAVALATATPSSLHWVAGPAGKAVKAPLPVERPAPVAKSAGRDETRVAKVEPKESPAPSWAHGSWVIQIGATDAADKAQDLLTRAKSEGRSALASARPFTEKVRKGDSTLYRARFAGLDTTEAEAACKTLKRSGFACFATKD